MIFSLYCIQLTYSIQVKKDMTICARIQYVFYLKKVHIVKCSLFWKVSGQQDGYEYSAPAPDEQLRQAAAGPARQLLRHSDTHRLKATQLSSLSLVAKLNFDLEG